VEMPKERGERKRQEESERAAPTATSSLIGLTLRSAYSVRAFHGGARSMMLDRGKTPGSRDVINGSEERLGREGTAEWKNLRT